MNDYNKRGIIAAVLSLTTVTFFFVVYFTGFKLTTFAIWVVYSVIALVTAFRIYPRKQQDAHSRQQAEQRRARNIASLKANPLPMGRYKGVAKTYPRNNPVYLVLLMILFALVLIPFIVQLNYYLIAAACLALLYLAYLLIFETVTISPEGIGRRHHFKYEWVRWDDVKTVALTMGYNEEPEQPFGSLCVSKEALNEDIKSLSKKQLGYGVIIFGYRPKLVHHILANYQGEIRYLELVDSWVRYVSRAGAGQKQNDR